MNLLGVDPGIRGGLAIVLVADGAAPQLLDAIDIPVTGVGAKERVDVIAIRSWIEQHAPGHALIERAQAMPKQGASSGFKYGRAVGAIEAVIACCAIPLTIVEPSQRGGAAASITAISGSACPTRAETRSWKSRRCAHRFGRSATMKTRTAADQKLADDARLLRAWRRWHREELEAALAGPHGAVATRLVQLLRDLTLKSAPVLLNFVHAQIWNGIEHDTRFTLLHEIDAAITRLRSRNGMLPFDDPPGDDSLNVFLTIRTIVFPPPRGAPPGAQPGLIQQNTLNQEHRT